MKPLPRSTSERKLPNQIITAETFDINPQIKRLTIKSKELYRPFNVLQLQMSRLTVLKGYNQLIQQLIEFNLELQQWKANKKQIHNLVVTYHLYENLFSRLRFISVFSNKQEHARQSIEQTIRWFAVEKPEKRNLVQDIDPELIPRVRNPMEDIQLQQMMQSNTIKHQMQVFQAMARTAHTEFFPPRQRLKDYRRKSFVPLMVAEKQKQPMTAAHTTATSFTSKLRRTPYRDSLATRSSFKDTKSSFKFEEKNDAIPQDQQIQKLAEVQQQRQDEQKEKIVLQQQVIQESIVPKNYQEDQPDQEENLEEESEPEEQPSKELRVKKYARDPDPDQELLAQQAIKQCQQSTIRRIINHKQEKIRIKLEELDIKRHMNNWAKIHAKNKSDESRKLEEMLHVNQYRKIEHRIIDPYQKPKNPEEINNNREVPMLYRSKSSLPRSMESQLQKFNIKETIRTYGRYIQHGNFKATVPESEEQHQQLKRLRGVSLTSHTDRQIKNQHFSDLLRQNNSQAYNEQNLEYARSIKNTFSMKNISVSNKNIYKSLTVHQVIDLKGVSMYTAGRSLLSNPYFPKHLYQTKKKTNKKKK